MGDLRVWCREVATDGEQWTEKLRSRPARPQGPPSLGPVH